MQVNNYKEILTKISLPTSLNVQPIKLSVKIFRKLEKSSLIKELFSLESKYGYYYEENEWSINEDFEES